MLYYKCCVQAYNCGFGEWNGITVAIVCIYVEDRALSVGDRVLSHQPQIQDMNIGTSYINTLEITFTYQVTGKTTAKNKQLKKQ